MESREVFTALEVDAVNADTKGKSARRKSLENISEKSLVGP